MPADLSSVDLVTRARVQELEDVMRQAPAHLHMKLEVRHHFAPGIYMRELIIPAGTITTGKIHKYPCLNILAKGKRATIINGRIEIIEAPHIHLSEAGMKRVSYTIEDAVWITVHNTNERDIEKLESNLVCDTEQEYLDFQKSSGLIECHLLHLP